PRLDLLGLDLRPGPETHHDLPQRLPASRADALEGGREVEDHAGVEGSGRVGDLDRTMPTGDRGAWNAPRVRTVDGKSRLHDLRRILGASDDPLAERIDEGLDGHSASRGDFRTRCGLANDLLVECGVVLCDNAL